MWTESRLDGLLTKPSQQLIEKIGLIDGDITVLGASGKMGPTLCMLINNAIRRGNLNKKVIAVARFTDSESRKLLEDNGIETVTCDLTDPAQVRNLPDSKNIIYMVGRKFGTGGNECLTWAINAAVPAYVIDRYRNANYVVFSSGNIYPYVPPHTGGNNESVNPSPIGEYAMSCLARERVFEYAAREYGAKIFMYRLNYAVDLRYGVLYDIARNLIDHKPISLKVPSFNCVWQGYANEVAVLGLLYADNPVHIMNVTGPETISVRKAAYKLCDYLGISPVIDFTGEEGNDALLNDASHCFDVFGYPSVTLEQLIKWQAEWILSGGRSLDKPTHFEERHGNF
jgi:Nucleoside-diphosphate-sugar epimerases